MLKQVATLYTRHLWKQFEATTHRPAETQQRVLTRLLKYNAQTAFGKEHGFEAMRTVADFKRGTPIRSFAGFDPWVDRIAAGEKSVLTREPVIFFNKSSGTSGKPKLIPVTQTWVNETGRLRKIWGGRAADQHPPLMDGKAISIVYSAEGGQTAGGIPYGALSGRVFQQSPLVLRRRYALPYEIARITDPAAKQYAAMRLAMTHNVTFLFSTNAATVLSMVETGEQRAEELIRDIADGTLSTNLDLPDDIRKSLAPYLKADPEAAHRLDKITREKGRLRPMDYWPDSTLLGCWLGSTVGVASRHLGDWFSPSLVLRDLGFAASEGVFTLPVTDLLPYGPLTVDTNFYEFIPVENSDESDPPTLTAEQLTVGSEYVIVITTSAGLYRYNINDVVRVAGMYHGTPMVEFVRKGSDCTNLSGEKMDISHILAVMEGAQRESGISILNFKVQADMEKFQYRFHVELDDPAADKVKLARALEKNLAEANPYYAKWIKEKQLNPLEVCVMKQGWFERYVNLALLNGARHGQFKPTLLSIQPEPDHEKLEAVSA